MSFPLINGADEPVARLQINRVTKPQLLENIGDNFFTFPNLAELGLEFGDVLGLVPENEGKLIQRSTRRIKC
ncbi:hypothetical protein KHA80_11525 [Anaerobacillus sp. HL2]|nr:hypothetical protein KHA80_11525 [Anaerobacillus sp. HL2]